MKPLSLALAFSVIASGTFAQSRRSTTNMSCGAANNLVLSQGAAVLGTGGDTFDRFVRDASFCPRGQVLMPAFAPTTDQRQCQIGWRCFNESRESR